jgi:hypothetical protein
MVDPFHALRALRALRVAVNHLQLTAWRTSDHGLDASRFTFHALRFAYQRLCRSFAFFCSRQSDRHVGMVLPVAATLDPTITCPNGIDALTAPCGASRVSPRILALWTTRPVHV